MSREYLRQAYEFAAKNSTDRSTQNGAILVDGEGNIVAWGANKFPMGVAETPERLERPEKYEWVVHAEQAAIFYAARNGIRTAGLTMYGTWVACNNCAKAIVDTGIIKVVGHKKTMDIAPERWLDPIEKGRQMFKEKGVVYELWEGDIGGIELLFNGQPFRP
jgi:dCMP deaminase